VRGCRYRYYLEVYGRQNYSFVASGALNRVVPLSALVPAGGPPSFPPQRHIGLPGEKRAHAGAGGWRSERPLDEAERLAVEFNEQCFEHAARSVPRAPHRGSHGSSWWVMVGPLRRAGASRGTHAAPRAYPALVAPGDDGAPATDGQARAQGISIA
jgi:hypothetical protein